MASQLPIHFVLLLTNPGAGPGRCLLCQLPGGWALLGWRRGTAGGKASLPGAFLPACSWVPVGQQHVEGLREATPAGLQHLCREFPPSLAGTQRDAAAVSLRVSLSENLQAPGQGLQAPVGGFLASFIAPLGGSIPPGTACSSSPRCSGTVGHRAMPPPAGPDSQPWGWARGSCFQTWSCHSPRGSGYPLYPPLLHSLSFSFCN